MMASASLMTLALAGKKQDQAQVVAEQFRAMLMTAAEVGDDLGDLAAFADVRDLPSRIKCAMLPWRSLWAALHFEELRN
jgi:nitrogen fixation protein NifU and related proteins